jgi:predicted acetyltransferase
MNDLRSDLSLEITSATSEEQPVLSNLYQLYIHDFTDFVEQPLGSGGRFDYDPLPQYWTEAQRFPLMFRVNGKLAGFALVKRGSDFSKSPEVWDMADFFVVRGLRRKGIGLSATQSIWALFPGVWEIRVIPTNIPARDFWTKAISRYLSKSVKSTLISNGNEERHFFSFESEANPIHDPE